jgi:hypothetical protein
MKTVKRKRALLNGHVEWQAAPTDKGAPIDELFVHNINTMQIWIGQIADSAAASR